MISARTNLVSLRIGIEVDGLNNIIEIQANMMEGL